MTWFRGSLSAALLLLAASVAQAQELKLGTNYQDSVQLSKTMGGIVLPLPAGPWRLTDLKQSRIAGPGYNLPVESGVLVPPTLDAKVKQIKSLITYWQASADSEHAGWTDHPVCNDPASYHIFQSDENRRRKKLRCWAIKLQSVAQSAQVPEFLISVTYFWAEQSKAMHVTYYFNPRTAGFAPVTQQGWNKDRIASDPKKVKYVEDLKVWATGWQAKIEQGFVGKAP